MRFPKTIVVAMLLLGFTTAARAESLIAEYIGLLAEEQTLITEIIILGNQIDQARLSCAELETKIRLLSAKLAYYKLTAAEEESIRAQINSLNRAIRTEEEDIVELEDGIMSRFNRLYAVGQRIREIEYIMDNR